MLETSLKGFSWCWRLLRRDFHSAEDFWDFHFAGDLFRGIFTVLETSLADFQGAGDFFGGIFTVLETSGIFTVLDTSSGDFFGEFSRCCRHLLETSLEGFPRCSRY